MTTPRPTPDGIARARALRQRETRFEARLWRYLRKRKLAGFKFRRQHPVGPWVVDFVCLDPPIAIEVDGGVHHQPEQAARDRNRDATLTAMGFRVIRVTNEAVFDDIDAVLARIAATALTP